MADVSYVSRVRVEPVKGRVRRAFIPAENEPVFFGVHDEVDLVKDHHAALAVASARVVFPRHSPKRVALVQAVTRTAT